MASGLPSPNLLISHKLVFQVFMYHERISEMLARRGVNMSTYRLSITAQGGSGAGFGLCVLCSSLSGCCVIGRSALHGASPPKVALLSTWQQTRSNCEWEKT